MEQIKDLLRRLGINKEPQETDDGYIVKLDDSDEFAKIYSKLDNIEDIDLVNLKMDEQGTQASYMSDDYDIVLYSDYDGDKYELQIKVVGE